MKQAPLDRHCDSPESTHVGRGLSSLRAHLLPSALVFLVTDPNYQELHLIGSFYVIQGGHIGY